MKNFFTLLFCVTAVLLSSCQDKSSKTVTLVDPEVFLETLEKDNSGQLVDVRTTEEFAVGHLKNAQNICVTDDDFEEKIKKLDKSKPVYVYCRSGGRSARAAKILEEKGFTKVFDLNGGITSWKEKGLQTEQ